MLQRIIDFSLKNKFLVLLGTLALVLGGVYAVRNIPLDAIPDLSDTQVSIYTEWEGQAPNIVQDQVTYPITTKMLSVPGAKVVRGYSFYRSEEHTSELQSPYVISYAVFCLKKKNNK